MFQRLQVEGQYLQIALAARSALLRPLHIVDHHLRFRIKRSRTEVRRLLWCRQYAVTRFVSHREFEAVALYCSRYTR